MALFPFLSKQEAKCSFSPLSNRRPYFEFNLIEFSSLAEVGGNRQHPRAMHFGLALSALVSFLRRSASALWSAKLMR